MKSRVTYYGTREGGRVRKYLCTRCDEPLRSVRDDDDVSILKCTACGTEVGYTRRLPKPPMPGQLDIEGNEA